MHEMAIWRLLGNHLHVVSLVESFRLEPSFYIVMETYGRDALEVLLDHGTFSEARAGSVAHQTASALQFVHDKSIVHRDVKLENLVRRRPPLPASPRGRGAARVAHADDALVRVPCTLVSS